MLLRIAMRGLAGACATPLLLTLPAQAQCPDGTPPPCAGARAVLPTVAVLPFQNRSRDSADAYLAWTLTEDVTAAITDTRATRVLTAPQRQRATWVVSGSALRLGANIRFVAQLERGGEIRWTTRLEGPLANAAMLRDSLGARVIEAMGIPVRRPAHASRAVDPVAYDLWLRGRYLWPRRRQADVAQSVTLLQQAVVRDSMFAAAWIELARALDWARRWRFAVPGVAPDSLMARTLAAAERATLLDSTDAAIWALRAAIASAVDPTSSAIGLHALGRAIALDSANSDLWNSYALALEESGDTSAAVAAWRHARALDPTQPLPMFGYHFYMAARYDSAALYSHQAVASDPQLMFYRELDAEVAFARGQLDEAEAGYRAALLLGSGREQVRALCGLAAVRAARGDTAEARGLVTRALAVVGDAPPTNHDAIALAGAYAVLRESTRAIRLLQAYQPRGDLHFQWHLRGDVPLEPLRGEPAFRALLIPVPSTTDR